MEPTLPDKPEAFNAGHITAMLQTASNAFAHAAENQAGAVRTQSEANVRMAEIDAGRQLELARIASGDHQRAIGNAFIVALLVLALIAGLVVASFLVGRYEIATHALTAVGGVAAGFLAGRSKR